MATITKGKTFTSGETVTPTKLNDLVDNATIAFVTADDTDDSTLEASAGKLRAKDAGITAAKLADGAVTGAAGGGKVAASAITGQTQLADPLAAGDEFLVHDTSASALRRVAFNAMQPAGSVLQTLQDSVATYSSINSIIAKNDTAPTSASGTQVLSKAIEPSSSANSVLVRLSAWVTTSTALYPVAVILRGSTVIQVVAAYSSTNERATFSAEILDSPATTSSTTYSVRFGTDSGTIYVNGSTSSREYGGTSKATLTLQEIKG